MFLPLTQRSLRACLLSTVTSWQNCTSAAAIWLLAVSMVTGSMTVASSAPSREALLHKLITRALGLVNIEAQVLPGQLPKPLPIDLPLPQQAQVIGSIVRARDQRSYQIYLDVPDSPEQVQSFYQTRLQAIGWRKQELPFFGQY